MTLLLFAVNAKANSSWQRLDDRLASAVDFYDQESGLVGFIGPSNVLTKIENGVETGVYSSPQQITSIAIQDSNSAWAVVGGTKLLHGTKAWTDWQVVATAQTSFELIFATRTTLFLLNGGVLSFTQDGKSIPSTNGIPPNAVTAMDSLNDSTMIATTSAGIYRSRSGGLFWTQVKDQLRHVRSVFADRINDVLYVGGDTVMESFDEGTTWQQMKPPISRHIFTMDGQVYGTHDCTGTFYLSNGTETGGDILRSSDQSLTLVTAGKFPDSEDTIHKGFVFDRGSTFYWWDKNGAISVSRDGLDSLIIEGIVPEFQVSSVETDASLCPDPNTTLHIVVSSGGCIPLQIDSISVLQATGAVNSKIKPVVVDIDTTSIILAYAVTHSGLESVRLRVWYRTIKYPRPQSRDVSVQVLTTSEPAAIDYTPNVAFGKVTVDSLRTKTFTITNTGCDTLRVDSVVSTNTDIFTLDPHTYPALLGSGRSLAVTVHYHPSSPDSTIEALEVGTSIKHFYVELSGTGVKEILDVEPTIADHFELLSNPISERLTIRSAERNWLQIYDAIGRVCKLSQIEPGETTINVNDLAAGTYIVRVGSSSRKLLIER